MGFRQRVGVNESGRLKDLNDSISAASYRHLQHTEKTLGQGERVYSRHVGQLQKRDHDTINQLIDVMSWDENQTQKGYQALKSIISKAGSIAGAEMRKAEQRDRAGTLKNLQSEQKTTTAAKEGGVSGVLKTQLERTEKGKEIVSLAERQEPLPPPTKKETEDHNNVKRVIRSEDTSLLNQSIAAQDVSQKLTKDPWLREEIQSKLGPHNKIKSRGDRLGVADYVVENFDTLLAQWVTDNPDKELEFTLDDKKEFIKIGDIANDPRNKDTTALQDQLAEYFSTHVAGAEIIRLVGRGRFQTHYADSLNGALGKTQNIYHASHVIHKKLAGIQGMSITGIQGIKANLKDSESLQWFFKDQMPKILHNLQLFNQGLGSKAPNKEALKQFTDMVDHAIQAAIFQDQIGEDSQGNKVDLLQQLIDFKVPAYLTQGVPKSAIDSEGMVLASVAWPKEWGEAVIHKKWTDAIDKKLRYNEKDDRNSMIAAVKRHNDLALSMDPSDPMYQSEISKSYANLAHTFGDRWPEEMNKALDLTMLMSQIPNQSFEFMQRHIKDNGKLNPSILAKQNPLAIQEIKRVWKWDGKSEHKIYEHVNVMKQIPEEAYKEMVAFATKAVDDNLKAWDATKKDNSLTDEVKKHVIDYEIPQMVRKVIKDGGYTTFDSKTMTRVAKDAGREVNSKILAQRDKEGEMYGVSHRGYEWFFKNRGAIPGIRKTPTTRGAESAVRLQQAIQFYSQMPGEHSNPAINPMPKGTYPQEMFQLDPDGSIHDDWYQIAKATGGGDAVEIMNAAAKVEGMEAQQPIDWELVKQSLKDKKINTKTITKNLDNEAVVCREYTRGDGRPIISKEVARNVLNIPFDTSIKDKNEQYNTFIDQWDKVHIPKAIEFINKNPQLKCGAAIPIALLYHYGLEPKFDSTGRLITGDRILKMTKQIRSGGLL